jgi:hypothetical protein
MHMVWSVLSLAAEKAGGLFPRYVNACRGLFEHRATSKTAADRVNLVLTCCYLLAKRKPIICEAVRVGEAAAFATNQQGSNKGEKKSKETSSSKIDYLFFCPTKQDAAPSIDHFMCRGHHSPEIKEVKISGHSAGDDRKTSSGSMQLIKTTL